MKKPLTFVKITASVLAIFIAFFLFYSSPIQKDSPVNPWEVYVLRDVAQVGDYNQALGTIKQLEIAAKHSFSVKEFSFDEIKKFRTTISSKSPPRAILAVGEKGADFFIKFHKKGWPLPSKTLLCHLSHQVTGKHGDLLGKVHLLALPAHALTHSFRRQIATQETQFKTKLVETIGVAHALTQEDIAEDYQKNKSRLPLQNLKSRHLVMVMIAGDSTNPDGSIHIYTENSARLLAQSLKHNLPSNSYFIILNGPRTGKYDPKTHAIRDFPNASSDPVTIAFLEELEKQGFRKDVDFAFFPFKLGQPSIYKTVLGLLHLQKGTVVLPAESISMLSESIDVLPLCRLLIYCHEAMNEYHFRHALIRQEMGQICIMKEELIECEKKPHKEVFQNAALCIANSILKLS